MVPEKSLKINKYGQAILSSDHLCELLLQGKNIGHLVVERDKDIELYEQFQSELLKQKTIFMDPQIETEDIDDFHHRSAEQWIFPEIYQMVDVHKWLMDKCTIQEQRDRVNEEYTLYEQRDLVMLLRLFIYLISYMRENKMVWGVGRGSAVSSYILFLIGVHRVDSIKYNLSISDYLK